MTTATLRPAEHFARSVRAALSDLPADEIDDLTDGLEADLDERASDEDSPDFGDPVAYALELRTAAGLPERQTGSSLGQAVVLLRDRALQGLEVLRAHRAVAAVLGFVTSLRAVWWVYRGWTIFLWFEFGLGSGIHALPVTLAGTLVFIGALIVSVQFGRGRWMPWLWIRAAVTLANIALVISTPFIVAWAINASRWY